MRAALTIFFIFLLNLTLVAQQDSTWHEARKEKGNVEELDTSLQVKPHSPTRASLYSMVLPGLGQAYNKKYWKIPLVYAGIGIPLYYGILEQKDFNDARDEYRGRINMDTTDAYALYSDEALLELIDTKRYNRDLLFIISTIIYVLNIVDASVDAHFFEFDVTDDLSLHWQPAIYQMNASNRGKDYMKGFTLTLNF